MAGRYNQWLRQKLAARIEHNGGYHARHNSYALSWCVRYYGVTDSAEEAKAGLVEHGHFINGADLELQYPHFDEWWEHIQGSDQYTPRALYDYAQGCLTEDLASDEGLRMWSPETAERYGFKYEGAGADRPFDMVLDGCGSGGKHVCLTEFEGVRLNCYNRELVEWVGDHLNPDPNESTLSNRWCRMLMGIMDELDETLTDENAKRCGHYYETDWLARELGLFD